MKYIVLHGQIKGKENTSNPWGVCVFWDTTLQINSNKDGGGFVV